jgi:putative ABC transport system permease protein
MSLIDALRYRLRVLLHPDSYGRELEDEIAHHLELGTADQQHGVRASLPDAEARRRAIREFGNVTYAAEERRIASGVALFDALRQDVQFVFRVFGRRRTFAAVTIGTLALGVGAATSIFTVADVVLFRPLALPNADRLITVWQTQPELKLNPVRAAQWDHRGFSLPVFRDWRAVQTSFEDIALWGSGTSIVGGTEAPEEIGIIHASASMLPVLGVRPELGRGFTRDEDDIGGPRVALVSHEAWVARMASDPAVIGRQVRIDSVAYSIVGVLPPGLTIERNATPPSYWIPLGQDVNATRDRGNYSFRAIARLKPGISINTAKAQTERLLKTLQPEALAIHGTRLVTLHEEQTRNVRRPILILLAAAGLLMLIACANVATVFMGEASNREAELRARMALGASRTRLVRQLLTESIVLALIGGVLGTMLAYSGTKLIVRFAPPWTPGLSDVHVDTRVLAAALAVSCATGLLFGIVPALLLSQSSANAGLRLDGQSTRGRGRSQKILIACEVAVSMVLLVAAGLLVQSFEKISSVDLGFRAERLLVVQLRLPQPQYADSIRVRALCRDILSRVGALPGVASVAVTTTPPFSGGSSSSSFAVEGRPVVANAPSLDAQRRITTPDFFATAGIAIVDGRAYTAADRADMPPVIVVSRSLARREWPNEAAVGKRIKWMGTWRTVIGVASDIKLHDLYESARPTVYAPLAQLIRRNDPSLVVRVSGDPAGISAAIRAAIHDAAADVPVSGIDEMSSLVAASLSDERFRTALISLFAVLAGLLAAVGMYGVAATAASRRTREMAIRSALGASSGSIARLIVGAGAGGVAVGAMVGVGLALIGTRALAPYLYAIGTADPATYVAVLALLVVTTLAATWVPARRAMRVPLVETLRNE